MDFVRVTDTSVDKEMLVDVAVADLDKISAVGFVLFVVVSFVF